MRPHLRVPAVTGTMTKRLLLRERERELLGFQGQNPAVLPGGTARSGVPGLPGPGHGHCPFRAPSTAQGTGIARSQHRLCPSRAPALPVLGTGTAQSTGTARSEHWHCLPGARGLPVLGTGTARSGHRHRPPRAPGLLLLGHRHCPSWASALPVQSTGTAPPGHRHCPLTTGGAQAGEDKGVPDPSPGPAPAVAPSTQLGSGDEGSKRCGQPRACTFIPHCTPVLHPAPPARTLHPILPHCCTPHPQPAPHTVPHCCIPHPQPEPPPQRRFQAGVP